MICFKCGEEGAERRRQRTAYVDDEQNFGVFCDKCQEEEDAYWDEQWRDYYASVL